MRLKLPTILLSLSIFFTGATGLVNEYILSTVSTYILGNSIEQFSITIAVMLLFMGIGGFVQKYINDNYLIEKFITIEILLTIFGSFAPILIYMAFGYMEHHFNLILYFLIAFIGFLVGFEIPFVTRINEKYSSSLKTNLAFIISADYVGAFLGAVIWVKLLLPHVHIFKVGFIIGSINFLVAFFTFLYFKNFVSNKIKVFYFILISLVFILLTYGYTNSERFDKLIEQKLYEDKVVLTHTTKYQHITITHNNLLDEYRLYLNGNLQFSSLDEKRYHELLVHPPMSLVNKHENILVLGGGDGLAVREIKKYQTKNITLVDLDPHMTQLAKTNKILTKLNKNSLNDINITTPKLETLKKTDLYLQDKDYKNINYITTLDIVNIDAFNFLQKIKDKKFDVVIIDLPDPNSIELSKLYTKEFYKNLQKHMNPNAILSVQSSSSYFAKEVFLGIGRTLEASGLKTIPYHHNIPSFGEWGFYLASKNNLVFNNINHIKFNVDTNYLSEKLFLASLEFGKDELKTNKKYINTLMNPKLYHEYSNNSWLNY